MLIGSPRNELIESPHNEEDASRWSCWVVKIRLILVRNRSVNPTMISQLD